MPALAPSACTTRYRRREPEKTIYDSAVRGHIETMLAQARAASDSGAGLPLFVEHEFRAYLDCGQLARGFLRARCEACEGEILVPFSCKRRAACPSCATRRMQDGGERLLDGVLPRLPWRQWVTSYPKWLRLHLAVDAKLNSQVIALSLREIFRWQRRRARQLGHRQTRVLAVSFLQRFGSALQLNPHAHSLLPDGVYGPRFANALDEPPQFIRVPPPTDDDVTAILLRIVDKVQRLAERLGLRERPLSDELEAFASTLALPLPRSTIEEPPVGARRSAFFRGFSIHANVFCHENDRAALGRLCRYALRPPFALERLSLTPTGDIAYKMKRPLPDGTTTLVLTPTALLRRIASLVPPPRRHLVVYHGVLSPHARDRAIVVPRPLPPRPIAPPPPPPPVVAPSRRRSDRLPWAELLRRVFAVDVFACDRCGGRRRILAAVTHPDVVTKILSHLALPTRAPPVSPARAPPDAQLELPGAHFDPSLDAPCSVE